MLIHPLFIVAIVNSSNIKKASLLAEMYQFAAWNALLNFFSQSLDLFRSWILAQQTKELQVSTEMSLFIPVLSCV